MVEAFGKVATGLARNPLGIIALFIVLVYGFACLLTGASSSFSPQERLPLIYFIVGFPILVLLIFAWLVACHSAKLFAPSDFKDEGNYVKMQLSAVASLTAAVVKREDTQSPQQIEGIIDAVRGLSPNETSLNSWRNHIIWVDDRPQNNIYERQAFEAFGIRFTIALSTSEALEKLRREKFAAIISDMGRKEGPREGYVLLDAIRAQRDNTPLFFYASSNAPEHKHETEQHGGQGCTNDAEELFRMVTTAVVRSR